MKAMWKKIILCLLLMMVVGCGNKDLKFETDKEFEITNDVSISFKYAKEYHYGLHNEITDHSPSFSYKAIQMLAMINNESSKDIDNILDILDFSVSINGEHYPIVIQDNENKYDMLVGDQVIKVEKNRGNVVFMTFTLPGYTTWEKITLIENNSQNNWTIMPLHVGSEYYVQPNDDVTFFERMTTLNSFQGELSRFYGVQIDLEEGYTIYGVTEDEELIALSRIEKTDETIITQDHLTTTKTNWYGSALYPIKGYIVSNRNGDDRYIQRPNYPKEITTTYRRYFSGNEQGMISFEMDGKTYQTQIPFSAVVHYKDGKIEKVDSFVYHHDLTWNIPYNGQKGNTGSYELLDDGKNAEVKLKFKYLSEQGESSLITLKGIVN